MFPPHWGSGLEPLGSLKTAHGSQKHLTTWSPSHPRSQPQIHDATSAGSRSCQESRPSHGVIEHDILLGELQQHRVIEELADADVFAQALWSGGKCRKEPCAAAD